MASRYDSFNDLLAEATQMRAKNRRADEAWLGAVAAAGGASAFQASAGALRAASAALNVGLAAVNPLGFLLGQAAGKAAGWMVARAIDQVRASADADRMRREQERLDRARRDYELFRSMRRESELKFRERVDRLFFELANG